MKTLLTLIALLLTQFSGQAADLPTGNQFYVDNLVYVDPLPHLWVTALPASQGVDGAKLASGADIIGAERNARAMLVARNGQLIFEKYFNNANAQQARNIHSASKSILSTAVGIAIKEEKLSLGTTLQDALSKKFTVPKNKQTITVKHLLTMTSGISWNEDSTEYQASIGRNRIQGILNLGQRSSPGTRFNYSTGDATLLAAVLTEKTGNSYATYTQNTLLGPLGISVERWGIDPQGYYSGGCNFFITPRELLRFGQGTMDARNSASNLVDSAWMKTATTPQIGGYYGFMWWTDIGNQGYRAWGWGKQFIYVWPAKQLVCVTVYDTAGRVSDGDNLSVITRYVYGAVR